MSGLDGGPVAATATPATAAPSTSSTLMQAIRAATFEVVLRKPANDPIAYEKPLPMELLPFAQRNDAYLPIGTAFAIGSDRFVTAAHVTDAASGSLMGTPALRDGKGNVYAIDQVMRYSVHEDFIEFTVTGAPPVTPLPTSTEFRIDTPVLAVGNALGEGIVARDGMLTSETPEERDGRWKWLRFSAPASPGNSGGPLLDAQGRVIGVIARKSANENLNYAVPIARVLQAPAGKAVVDMVFTGSLPNMSMRASTRVQAGFDLPLPFAAFDQRLIAGLDQFTANARAKMLQESATQIFPQGNSSRLLADTHFGPNPSLIMQAPTGSWEVIRNNEIGTNLPFGDNGLVWMFAQQGVTIFRVQYPRDVDPATHRQDGRFLADQLLKALPLSRVIGTERVRITSFGDPGRPVESRDDHGRVWQQWLYPMAFADMTMIVSALPTPEGYVGFVRSARGGHMAGEQGETRELMDFFQATYSGTSTQWQAFLADQRLRPAAFAQWKARFEPAGQLRLELPRMVLSTDPALLKISPTSLISVIPGVLLDGGQPVWDVLALQVRAEPRDGPRLIAYRRAHPAADAGLEPVSRWQAMAQRQGQFAGSPGGSGGNVWVRNVVAPKDVAATEAGFLYELLYITSTSVPRDAVTRAGTQLPALFEIREK